MGLKIGRLFKAPINNLQQTVKKIKAGDIKGAWSHYADNAGYITGRDPDDPNAVDAPAAVATIDPNIEIAAQLEEEKKRRRQTPGRAQYSLNQSSTPSLIGDNSVLGKNSLY